MVAYENVSDNGIKGYFRGMPVGYRFMPNDEELVNYLKHKVEGFPLPLGLVHDVDIYKFHPHELTGKYELIGEREWYFFTPRNRISPDGSRPSRKASNGYWKPTGSEKEIPNEKSPVGVRMSLDYYEFSNTEIQKRKQSSGTRTDWKMHEYIVKQYKDNGNDYRKKFHALALCKIYKKKAKNDEDEPAAGTSSSVPKNAPIQSQEPSSYGFQPISGFEEQAYWTQMMITANNLLVPQGTTYAELVNNKVTNVQPVSAQIVEDQRDNSCPDSQRQNDDSCPDNEHQNDDSGLYCIVHSSRSWNKRLEKNPN
ncbi:NAC domain-containing protein, putative [Ricinus communis]|uniref:NAC domain-containing protein, putative n=2 Tax=Ricinus communis TaxID=3988 RepID=B9S9K8_RICCO|nr:NAC domain-containing protein, putative [Ricinus communis]